jgi:cell division transport system permease protein
MRTWIRLTGQGIADLFRAPLALAQTLAVISLVAFLGAFFVLLLGNLEFQAEQYRGQVQFQVYWEVGADRDEVVGQWKELGSLPGLETMETFTSGQAMEILAGSFKDLDALQELNASELVPATALLQFSLPDGSSREWIAGMRSSLGKRPGVDRVDVHPLQSAGSGSWIAFFRTLFWPVIGLLALIVALVVGNTMKLAQLQRREELEILSLVGASPWYIRYPLVVGGAVQGAMGGCIALTLLGLVHLGARDVLGGAPLWIEIRFLTAQEIAVFLGGLILVGTWSSMAALRR